MLARDHHDYVLLPWIPGSLFSTCVLVLVDGSLRVFSGSSQVLQILQVLLMGSAPPQYSKLFPTFTLVSQPLAVERQRLNTSSRCSEVNLV